MDTLTIVFSYLFPNTVGIGGSNGGYLVVREAEIFRNLHPLFPQSEQEVAQVARCHRSCRSVDTRKDSVINMSLFQELESIQSKLPTMSTS